MLGVAPEIGKVGADSTAAAQRLTEIQGFPYRTYHGATHASAAAHCSAHEQATLDRVTCLQRQRRPTAHGPAPVAGMRWAVAASASTAHGQVLHDHALSSARPLMHVLLHGTSDAGSPVFLLAFEQRLCCLPPLAQSSGTLFACLINALLSSQSFLTLHRSPSRRPPLPTAAPAATQLPLPSLTPTPPPPPPPPHLQARGVEFVLPTDVVVADKFAADAESKVVPVTANP